MLRVDGSVIGRCVFQVAARTMGALVQRPSRHPGCPLFLLFRCFCRSCPHLRTGIHPGLCCRSPTCPHLRTGIHPGLCCRSPSSLRQAPPLAPALACPCLRCPSRKACLFLRCPSRKACLFLRCPSRKACLFPHCPSSCRRRFRCCRCPRSLPPPRRVTSLCLLFSCSLRRPFPVAFRSRRFFHLLPAPWLPSAALLTRPARKVLQPPCRCRRTPRSPFPLLFRAASL